MALQFALHSVAEQMGIPYVYAAWCPITLPSPHHAPPPLPSWAQPPTDGTADNRTLWAQDAKCWNDHWAAAIDSHRAAAGLGRVSDVRSHIFTGRPWLAADQTLAPWPETADLDVFQTGAWIRSDQRQLSLDLEAVLDAGEPPVYFGFGSMRAPRDVGQAIVKAARAVGRRAIVSRGWAGVTLPGSEPDCLSIEEVNLQALFRRVAAVVQHGGAGTPPLPRRPEYPRSSCLRCMTSITGQ
jgi:vancomycin aglycone glucosyltransferase